ncbi:hypothetical protein KZZ52_24825 [Dactylosporangium sp. AC04546]|nr:hypothetical protein [Dactylosporangium sp. AC04546]WVK88496.1 hypothetical protein KZZ52_24825 [Dactylosporangium sp. AC04546]
MRLQRDGFAAGPYRRLRAADAVRTAACLASAVGLAASVLLTFTAQ